MASGGSGHDAITVDDHGAILAMITWFLLCTLVLCTATRLMVRCTTRHLPALDDALVVLATAFSIASVIAISFAVQSGLGKRSYLLTPTNVSSIQKEVYVANIFYVLAVGVSKISIIIFLSRLACAQVRTIGVFPLGMVVIGWMVAITFGVSFQCDLPYPWDSFTGKCSPVPFWTTTIVVDMITDLAMILLPIYIVSRLQLAYHKKVVVILIFMVRLLLIAISTAQLCLLRRSLTRDPFFDIIPYAIATVCHTTFSVIVACSPALKPFIDHVRTGMLSASLAQHKVGTTFGQDSRDPPTPANTAPSISKPIPQSNRTSEDTLNPNSQIRTSYKAGTGTRKDPFCKVIDHPIMENENQSRPSTSSLASGTWSPPRPPSPPPELRPDMSMFAARVITNSPSLKNLRVEALLREAERARASLDGGERRKGGVYVSRAWDVKYDKRSGIQVDGPK